MCIFRKPYKADNSEQRKESNILLSQKALYIYFRETCGSIKKLLFQKNVLINVQHMECRETFFLFLRML